LFLIVSYWITLAGWVYSAGFFSCAFWEETAGKSMDDRRSSTWRL